MGFLEENDCIHADGYDCKLRKELCIGFSMISVDFSEPEVVFDRNMLKKCKSYEPCKP